MQKIMMLLIAALLSCGLTAGAQAHAFLDHAVPGVGTSMQGAPSELELKFTEDLVLAFSGVSLKAEGGAAVPVGKPTLSPANTLHVRLAHPLKPGTYLVSWHVVSVDTHRTSGTYKFTVTP